MTGVTVSGQERHRLQSFEANERCFGLLVVIVDTGFQSSEFFQLESAEFLLNEQLRVYGVHIHSYLGQRSFCFFKNAGFYSDYLQIMNASVLGANAAMVAIDR
ncbi:hypothetical protein [Halostella pelagica]|uniref:hypothetical protein n=1 Tax=Halostella pelagica TaxID=2583824 RepID=UPI001081A281|nr:hypothetical protein [Halostella pelagica]